MQRGPQYRQILAALIKSYDSRNAGRACENHERAPGKRGDWRVLETMSVDSIDYVLVARVQNPASGFDRLTAREREAVGQACAGASNKEIAHEMGVRTSTVRVLLWRACRKIGASDRDEMIRRFMMHR